MKSRSVLNVTFLALAAATRAQQDFSTVVVKPTHVAKNIYLLTVAAGTSASRQGRILIVDDQFAPLGGKITGHSRTWIPARLSLS